MTNAEWMKDELSVSEKIFIFWALQFLGRDMNRFNEWLDEEFDVDEFLRILMFIYN